MENKENFSPVDIGNMLLTSRYESRLKKQYSVKSLWIFGLIGLLFFLLMIFQFEEFEFIWGLFGLIVFIVGVVSYLHARFVYKDFQKNAQSYRKVEITNVMPIKTEHRRGRSLVTIVTVKFEVSFKVGERVLKIETRDLYGEGDIEIALRMLKNGNLQAYYCTDSEENKIVLSNL